MSASWCSAWTRSLTVGLNAVVSTTSNICRKITKQGWGIVLRTRSFPPGRQCRFGVFHSKINVFYICLVDITDMLFGKGVGYRECLSWRARDKLESSTPRLAPWYPNQVELATLGYVPRYWGKGEFQSLVCWTLWGRFLYNVGKNCCLRFGIGVVIIWLKWIIAVIYSSNDIYKTVDLPSFIVIPGCPTSTWKLRRYSICHILLSGCPENNCALRNPYPKRQPLILNSKPLTMDVVPHTVPATCIDILDREFGSLATHANWFELTVVEKRLTVSQHIIQLTHTHNGEAAIRRWFILIYSEVSTSFI